MDRRNEEARLLRRIAHLNVILGFADNAQILGTVRELIAEMETRIRTLQRDRDLKATRH